LSSGLLAWYEAGEFFEYQGQKIFYNQSGTGDDVVLCLHGFPTASYDFHKVWGVFSDNYSLLTFDMIGYGFSSKPVDFDYTTFAQVDLLIALLSDLKVSSVHIFSHDYGNTIVQELLARIEEGNLLLKIQTICFLNGALFPETHRPILAQKLLIGPIGALFGRLIPDTTFKRSLASIFGPETKPTPSEMIEFAQLLNFNHGKRIAHKLIRYMIERSVYRERWVGPLTRLKQPFIFINGIFDPVSGLHLVDRFRSVVPEQTNIIELDGIGHFPHFEEPERVIEEYIQFRKSAGPISGQ
jgi:pimeloyl-ACP methyl ester carboxylesterase